MRQAIGCVVVTGAGLGLGHATLDQAALQRRRLAGDHDQPGGIQHKTFYDHAGRRTKTIEAYTDGTPSPSDDRTTEFTYDGMDHLRTLKAVLPTGGPAAHQITEWVYGVTTSGTDPSDIVSNDLLREVRYPNKTDGNPSTSGSDIEKFAYNALGQAKVRLDRNGSKHEYEFDALGRRTADKVTQLGAGVDPTVQRLDTAYDEAGRAFKFTSYALPSGGTIVNQSSRPSTS